MRIEITEEICPLCRRSARSNNTDRIPTRLCGECRSMIQTIHPGACALPQATLYEERAFTEIVQTPFVGAPFDEDEVYESEAGIESSAGTSSLPAELPGEEWIYSDAQPGEDGSRPRQDFEEAWVGEAQIEERSIEENSVEAKPYESSGDFEATEPSAYKTGGLVARDSETAEAVEAVSNYDKAADDPWDDPLPAWDYSQNEWPIYVEAKTRRARSRLLIPALALILLAVAGAGYFLVAKPHVEESQAEANRSAVTTTEAKEPVDRAPDSAEERPQIPAGSEPIASVSSQPQMPESLPSSESAASVHEARGNLSLQAASFPTEGAASEFAEKLIRAGIPAYTTPADIGRRGTWYRVRVGRFTSADEAQKYASQSRLRAKAVGLNLQLMLCDYEKP